MSSHRVGRATEEIRRELSDIMRTLKDPRLNSMLSIVRIDLTNDYSHCTVFISSLDGLEKAQEAVEGLESAAGYIRRELFGRIKIRRIPEFHFVADDGIAYGAHIEKIMDDLNPGRKKENPDGD